MSQERNRRIQITTQLYPAYYPQFRCIADCCQDNCCHGWRISFGKKDYLKIKRTAKTPELEELTREAMHRLPDGQRTEAQYAEFSAQGGPCPYQNAQGLCRLQLECGEETLPSVCKQFPRVHCYTPMGKESVLSTGCEAVVELLWNAKEGLDFVEEPLERQAWREYEVSVKNLRFPVMREAVIDILQARQFSLGRRLLILGMVLDHARNQWETLDLEAWQARVQLLLSDDTLTQNLEDFSGDLSKFLAENVRTALSVAEQDSQLWKGMKAMGVVWDSVNPGEITLEFRPQYYRDAKKAFAEHFGDVEYFFENLAVNTAFWQGLPDVTSPEDLWSSYVMFCAVYSFMRFMALICCGTEPSREKLFRSVVLASRSLLHNRDRRSALQKSFFANRNESLAHMAVMVQIP